MASILSIISNFSLVNQGLTYTGKQGLAASAFSDELDITLTGPAHIIPFSLLTATVATLYDDDDDLPADWDYLYIWGDQDFYIQVIAGTSRAVFKVEALVPWWISGFDAMLADAASTLIAGGTEPTLVDIDSIVVGNYSGSTMNGMLAIMD